MASAIPQEILDMQVEHKKDKKFWLHPPKIHWKKFWLRTLEPTLDISSPVPNQAQASEIVMRAEGEADLANNTNSASMYDFNRDFDATTYASGSKASVSRASVSRSRRVSSTRAEQWMKSRTKEDFQSIVLVRSCERYKYIRQNAADSFEFDEIRELASWMFDAFNINVISNGAFSEDSFVDTVVNDLTPYMIPIDNRNDLSLGSLLEWLSGIDIATLQKLEFNRNSSGKYII
jgi:hypothetical protein